MRRPAFQYGNRVLSYAEDGDIIEPEDFINPACILLEFASILAEVSYVWFDP